MQGMHLQDRRSSILLRQLPSKYCSGKGQLHISQEMCFRNQKRYWPFKPSKIVFINLKHQIGGLNSSWDIGSHCRLPLSRWKRFFPLTVKGRVHRVDRVPGFLSSRPNWVRTPPSPAGECLLPSPPLFPGGHTRLQERGWADPIRTRGQTLWYGTLGIILYVTLRSGSLKSKTYRLIPLPTNLSISVDRKFKRYCKT